MSAPDPHGYAGYPGGPGSPPPPRASQTPLIVAVTAVLLAIIAATVFVLTRDDTNGPTATGETFQSPAAPVGQEASGENAPALSPAPAPDPAPRNSAAPPAPSPQPTTAAAAPSGRWSTAAPDIGQDCSVAGGTPVTIEITNRLSVPLALYWTNEGCEPREYGTIAPGATVTQDTYTGHRWDVGDGMDLAYAAFVPSAQSTRWVIQ